jgi:hypothetical protein
MIKKHVIKLTYEKQVTVLAKFLFEMSLGIVI